MTRLTSARVKVDIVSDTVCPWCLVGKRRLEQALKQVPGLDVSVAWHPFQLNPTAPEGGENKLQMYQNKFGPARVAQMLPMMQRTMAEVGVEYRMGGLTGNTFNSHKLIHWAGKSDGGWKAQDALVEELFLNYFSQEKFINDRDVLLAAVSKAGLDVREAEAVLDGKRPDIDQEVQQQLARARQQGISGVPFFTINDKYTLSGAQPPEEFVAIFKEILRTSSATQQALGANPDATACTRDGVCL